jgi:serine protease Do
MVTLKLGPTGRSESPTPRDAHEPGHVMRRALSFVILAALVAVSARAEPPAAPQPKGAGVAQAQAKPWFVDDEKLFDDFMSKLTDLAKDGKCLAHDKLVAKIKPGKKVKLTPAKPGEKVLSAEEIYKLALPSVFMIGSVFKDKEGEWQDGLYATAWVVGADGVLVTNWHVFEDLEEGEVFGAVDHKGNVYPVVEFLGGDKVADVAVVRIDAKGLAPLALSDAYPEIGSWVGVLGHPGDNYYVFTQGHVTRYSTNKNDDGKRERWMGVTAEYAGGSSGSPVLDKRGAVVGMAALTLTLDGGDGGARPNRRRLLLGQPPKKAPPPREKPDPKDEAKPDPKEAPKDDPKPAPGGSSVQMILKMAVPGPTILKSFVK